MLVLKHDAFLHRQIWLVGNVAVIEQAGAAGVRLFGVYRVPLFVQHFAAVQTCVPGLATDRGQALGQKVQHGGPGARG